MALAKTPSIERYCSFGRNFIITVPVECVCTVALPFSITTIRLVQPERAVEANIKKLLVFGESRASGELRYLFLLLTSIACMEFGLELGSASFQLNVQSIWDWICARRRYSSAAVESWDTFMRNCTCCLHGAGVFFPPLVSLPLFCHFRQQHGNHCHHHMRHDNLRPAGPAFLNAPNLETDISTVCNRCSALGFQQGFYTTLIAMFTYFLAAIGHLDPLQ